MADGLLRRGLQPARRLGTRWVFPRDELSEGGACEHSVRTLRMPHRRKLPHNAGMIPRFDENGYLPPGRHRANLAEIEKRFGRQSELRRVQMESVRWMVDLALRAGVLRIVLNGSFVTDIIEPNDVDCVLLVGSDFPRDAVSAKELEEALPFLDVALVDDADFDYFVTRFFAFDRIRESKGMIEVVW